VDGSGVMLYDLNAENPFVDNVADGHEDVVREMYAKALADAGGELPEYLVQMAADVEDVPGSSALNMGD
jgi:hypothetical protein